MKKKLIGLLFLYFFQMQSSASSSLISSSFETSSTDLESSSLETSSEEILKEDSLQSHAITVMNMDLKRRVYNYMQRKAREMVREIVKNNSKSVAYLVARNFFNQVEKRPLDIDLLVLSEYIRQIPTFFITLKMIQEKYSFMGKVRSQLSYGLISLILGHFYCLYREKNRSLEVKIAGIDNCILFVLADLHDLINRCINKCGITEIDDLIFIIGLSKYNQRNDLLMESLRRIKEKKSIIFSASSEIEKFCIPDSISRLKNIKELTFSHNQTLHVGKGVSKIRNLAALMIEYGNAVIFSDKFERMDSLESFVLKKENKGNTDISYIPRSVLSNMPNLTHLHLEDFFENMPQLLQVIASLSCLKKLYIEPYYHDALPKLLEEKITEKDTGGYLTLQHVLKFEHKPRYVKRSKSLSDIVLDGRY